MACKSIQPGPWAVSRLKIGEGKGMLCQKLDLMRMPKLVDEFERAGKGVCKIPLVNNGLVEKLSVWRIAPSPRNASWFDQNLPP